MSWGCDCKNTEQALEEKIQINKLIIVWSACCSYIFIVAKPESINQRMLDKWDYFFNQNLSYQKSFASTKILKQDQDYI